MMDDKYIAEALANKHVFWLVSTEMFEGMTTNGKLHDATKIIRVLVADAINAQRKVHFDETGVLIGSEGDAQLLARFCAYYNARIYGRVKL